MCSFSASNLRTSGTAVCIRNASSYDLNPGAQLGVVGILDRRQVVQPAQDVGLDRRLGGRHGTLRAGEGQRVRRDRP